VPVPVVVPAVTAALVSLRPVGDVDAAMAPG
jgi:hypothetical protein